MILKKDNISGLVSCNANIMWTREERSVRCGERQVERRVRDGMMGDETNIIKITVWGDLLDQIEEDSMYHFKGLAASNKDDELTVATNFNTMITKYKDEQLKVNWEKYDIKSEINFICCPGVISTKLNVFSQCPICKKKVVPMLGENVTLCTNIVCKRKFILHNSMKNYNIQLMVLDQTTKEMQNITIFPNVLSKLYSDAESNQPPDNIEERLLMEENIDITYNKNMIALSLKKHAD